MSNTIDICRELHQNFIDFAYEANSQRAFADARDGLKPGQRACLWEMYSKGYSSNKPHVKSAKISGGVIANWWPHGDTAIYDTFARMSQSWINNIPEVDWHGANGSQIISGEAAASRYTEARLAKSSEDGLFSSIKDHSVNMIKNFSEDDEWPEVLPALYPRLMVNGCQGIGVTIANVWLPHELSDLAPIIQKMVETGEVDYSNLYPSFPSGGIIINKKDIKNIYETGKGKVVVRAKTEIKGNNIFITEFPYQVYIEPWIETVKNLIISTESLGIDAIYNRSNKKGILIEIECRNNPNQVLNQLFKMTDLQKSYSANQFALVGKTPELLNLKQYLTIYLNHNYKCIYNEYNFLKEKAELRKEIVEGLLKALVHINDIIALIKSSNSVAEAQRNLIAKYDFTERQAKAIVDMKLGKLAHLEYIELENENKKLEATIKTCNEVLTSEDKRKAIFLERFNSFAKKYSKARKTEVMQIDDNADDKEIAEVIPEDVVVIVSKTGLIKRVPKESFKTQRRNGKGVKTADEAILSIIKTNTVDNLLLFTDAGKMYKLLVDNIPAGTNTSKGASIYSMTKVPPSEKIMACVSSDRNNDKEFVLFFTKNGQIKKTAFEEYSKTKRGSGIAAINLKENDSIVSIAFVNSKESVYVATQKGYCIAFDTSTISATGRATMGVKSIKLADNDVVIAGLVKTDEDLAVVTVDGKGKRLKAEDFVMQARGGKGVQISKDEVAGIATVADSDILLIIGYPNSICINASDLPTVTRTAQGNLAIKSSRVTGIAKL